MTLSDLRSSARTQSNPLAFLASCLKSTNCEFCKGAGRGKSSACEFCIGGSVPPSRNLIVQVCKVAREHGCKSPVLSDVIATKPTSGELDAYSAREMQRKTITGWTITDFKTQADLVLSVLK